MAGTSPGFLSMKHATGYSPLNGMLVHHMVTSWQCMLPVSIYTPGWRATKWIKVPCLRNQFDRRGLNPGPPDPEFKVLTVLSDTPPNWKRMHRNQAKKQSDGLAVLVLKTKSKWWKISYVMGRLTPDSHMEVRCLQVEPTEWSHQPLTQVARTPHRPAYYLQPSHEPHQPHPAPAQAPITLNWEFSEETRTTIILINTNNNNKRWGERGKTLNTMHCKTTRLSTCKHRCINYTPLTQGTLEIVLDRASGISPGCGAGKFR